MLLEMDLYLCLAEMPLGRRRMALLLRSALHSRSLSPSVARIGNGFGIG